MQNGVPNEMNSEMDVRFTVHHIRLLFVLKKKRVKDPVVAFLLSSKRLTARRLIIISNMGLSQRGFQIEGWLLSSISVVPQKSSICLIVSTAALYCFAPVAVVRSFGVWSIVRRASRLISPTVS